MRVELVRAGHIDNAAALPATEGVLLRSMRAWVLARYRAEKLHVEQRIEAVLDGLGAAEARCRSCGSMDTMERRSTLH